MLKLAPASNRVLVVYMSKLWNSRRSALAAASTSARCAAFGVSSVPTVGEVVWMSMYGAVPIDGIRPLALVVLTALAAPVLPATVGTSHDAGSVKALVPAPSYGVW